MKMQKIAIALAVSAFAAPSFAATGDIATLIQRFVTTPTAGVGNYTNIAVNDVAPGTIQNSSVKITQASLTDTQLNALAAATNVNINQTPIGLSVGSLGTNALSEINTNGIGSVNQGSVESVLTKLAPVVTTNGTNGGTTTIKLDNSVKGNVAAVGGISSTVGDKTNTVDVTTNNGSVNFAAGALTSFTAGTAVNTVTGVPSSLAGTSLTNLSYNVTQIDSSVAITGVASVAANNLKVSTNAIGALNAGNITVKGF